MQLEIKSKLTGRGLKITLSIKAMPFWRVKILRTDFLDNLLAWEILYPNYNLRPFPKIPAKIRAQVGTLTI